MSWLRTKETMLVIEQVVVYVWKMLSSTYVRDMLKFNVYC